MKHIIEWIFEFKKDQKLCHRAGSQLPENLQALALTANVKEENYRTEFDRPFHNVIILRDFTITIKLEPR